MIIVSQDKSLIINFDNVPVIAINNKENSREIYALTNGETVVSLGIYATEERAKEVLQEIQEYIEYQGKSFINEDMSVKHYGKIYKMPKE